MDFNNNKISFLSIILIVLFSFGYFSKSTAATIQSVNVDSYALTLNGSILNEVSGLIVKVQIKDLKGDIASNVTFSSNGASSLLSSVTGPEGDLYTITLALNGKIKDGKATINGKFIAGSLFPGTELNIIKVERDGGVDITNLLTTEILFKNSKATPTPTPTPTATPSATPTPEDTAPTPEPLSEEVQDQLDHFLDDNSGDIDLSEAGTVLEDAFANGDLSGTISLTGSDTFQLKSKGLNRYYARLNISGKANGFDRLLCEVATRDFGPDQEDNFRNPSYFKPSPLSFTLKLQEGKSYRINKRIRVPFLPLQRGLDILRGTNTSSTMQLSVNCASYSSNDDKLDTTDLTINDLVLYWLVVHSKDILSHHWIDIDVLSPKAANVSSQ